MLIYNHHNKNKKLSPNDLKNRIVNKFCIRRKYNKSVEKEESASEED